MADPSNIVPFGKYKGRLLEELFVDDPAYLQWLAGQDWFRVKYTILHQVIINRGDGAGSSGPRHRAICWHRSDARAIHRNIRDRWHQGSLH